MGLFNRKNSISTLRFCQSAVELDAWQLFSNRDLTLAISQLSEWHYNALQTTEAAFAFGVVHDAYGLGQPLLPVEIEFSFSSHYGEGDAGHGSIVKSDLSEVEYYQAKIIIRDPDRAIYSGFLRAFEHAVMSGNQYSHIILRREEMPHIYEGAEFDAEYKRFEALMVQVDAGESVMPNIKFNSVAFDDRIILKAPRWSSDWANDFLNQVKYHSKEAAAWRKRRRRR